MLKVLGFRERIHRKAHRNRPLRVREKQGNTTKSKTRARVEHVFGIQRMTAGDLLLRCVGLDRARAKIGLRNLAYNMRSS
ncbi:MAG: transposase [Planctomycetota bacterium]|nr:transposase [Planctomycetota bacterium]